MKNLLSAVVALVLSAALNAQVSFTVVPAFIVPNENVVMLISDPERANETATVKIWDGATEASAKYVSTVLDDDGNGTIVWAADLTGWETMWCWFRYIDSDFQQHYQYRPIFP